MYTLLYSSSCIFLRNIASQDDNIQMKRTVIIYKLYNILLTVKENKPRAKTVTRPAVTFVDISSQLGNMQKKSAEIWLLTYKKLYL